MEAAREAAGMVPGKRRGVQGVLLLDAAGVSVEQLLVGQPRLRVQELCGAPPIPFYKKPF